MNYYKNGQWVKKGWEMLISEVYFSSKILYFKWDTSDFCKLVESKLAEAAKSPISPTTYFPIHMNITFEV